MTATGPKHATFETSVTAFGDNTGVAVPPEVIDALEAGKRPPVNVDVGGYRYRLTVGVMAGRLLAGVSSAVRAATGLRGGAPVRVTLALADTPREVAVPEDLAAALAASRGALPRGRAALRRERRGPPGGGPRRRRCWWGQPANSALAAFTVL